MPPEASVVIPVEHGAEWNQARATSLPNGTPYVVAGYDKGHWAEAVNDAVESAQTPLVFLSAPDAWLEVEPDCLDFLSGLAWNADVTYGQLLQWEDGEPTKVVAGDMFCPHRLRKENYLPSVSCVRRDKFLEVGGVRTGMWDLYLRLLDAGARFKYVPEAYTARDEIYDDPSPTPTPHGICPASASSTAPLSTSRTGTRRFRSRKAARSFSTPATGPTTNLCWHFAKRVCGRWLRWTTPTPIGFRR